MKIWYIICTSLLLVLGHTGECRAAEADIESGTEKSAYLLEQMDFTEIQKMIDEVLGEERFSFLETVKAIMKGKDVISKETIQKLLYGLFFSHFVNERNLFARVLLLVILAAVFSNFSGVFQNGQVGEISFYVLFLMLFTILLHAFSEVGTELSETLKWIVEFMKYFTPAYYLAAAAATGITTAAVFYQGVLFLIWGIQWGLLNIFLPCTELYVLLCFVNCLSKEAMLTKLSDLICSFIHWGMKTLLGAVLGFQMVKGLIAPVIDALTRGAAGKAASAIPGIGNAVNSVTELLLTGAVLVRNSLGTAAMLVLLLVGARPVIRYFLMSVSYRLIAALSQPVSDKRMIGCLSTVGEGYMLYVRILFYAEFLCILTFLIMMVGFGGRA